MQARHARLIGVATLAGGFILVIFAADAAVRWIGIGTAIVGIGLTTVRDKGAGASFDMPRLFGGGDDSGGDGDPGGGDGGGGDGGGD